MRRREFLGLAALPLAQVLNRRPARSLRGRVIALDGTDAAGVELTKDWRDAYCRSRVTNRTSRAIHIKEVVLFDAELAMPPETTLYGEGFQMLTQTGGTLAAPVDFSQYTDAKHYRIAEAEQARSFYGLVTLTPPDRGTTLCAFTSCARFSGRFRFSGRSPAREESRADVAAQTRYRLAAIVDTEGLPLHAGETWQLEELMLRSGADRRRLLDELGDTLLRHHPRLIEPRTARGQRQLPPAGWCSWYCFGPRVTAQQVLDNLDAIAERYPTLRYVQIDDGYQSAMGDWLETGAAFGGNVRTVLDQIRHRGFEPAIWVAPFVAESESTVSESTPTGSSRTPTGLRCGPIV